MQAIDLSTWGMIRRLTGTYLRPHAGLLAVAILFMVIAAATTAVFAKLIEPVLDVVLVDRQRDMIVPMALAVFSVFLISGMATYIHTVAMNKIGQYIVASIQYDLFARFIGLDLKFFHDNPSGQLVSRIISDVNVVRAAVSDSLTGICKSFLTLLFLIILMVMQDAQLALIALCVFPPAALFVSILGRKLRKLSGNIQYEIAGLTDLFTQIFQGVRQVKAYGMEAFERDRARGATERVRALFYKGTKTATLSTPVNETLIGLALMGLIIYGGTRVVDGELTPGALMSFIAAFSLSYEPLKRLAKLNNTLQMGLGAGERILDMLDRQPEIIDRDGAGPLIAAQTDIVFDDASFSYGYDDGHALRGVSFTAPAGKVTALVGPSGSGKTTAMNCVLRFYDVTAGRILIGGQDIRDVTIESLRRHIALVSQDITIFDDTVRANIAYGTPETDPARIEAAAKAAAADEFIARLPQGYETRLGEQGAKLSGGQRQRVAIARAILRDAPLLLLDEATSALDNESERAIQDSLAVLQNGRTVLVVAHRLSTIQHADHIVVMAEGKVAEQGTHDQLMTRNGLYARMYRAGFEG